MLKHKETEERSSSTCYEYVAGVVEHFGTCGLKLVSQSIMHFCGIGSGIFFQNVR
jgi:hypothetical protein